MRLVLIAHDERDARRWVEQQPALGDVDVLWVSPDAPYRARGERADAVLVTPTARLTLPAGSYRQLLEESLPCVPDAAP